MTRTADIDPDEYAEVRQGRHFPYATVGDYVALSDVSDRACRVYWLLRMHVNGKRGDEEVWPSQRTLADILKLKKTDTIGAAIAELVQLGAVEVETVATPKGRANIYTVHEAPADDHDGPTRLRDYYEAKKAGQWGSTPGEGAPPNRKRIGGKSAAQKGSPLSGGSPRSDGGGHPSDRGDGSPPGQGSELPVVELPEVEGRTGVAHPTPVASAPSPAGPPPELRPNLDDRDTWRCPEHLELVTRDPGADVPSCPLCPRVVRAMQRQLEERDRVAGAATMADVLAADRAGRACRVCIPDGTDRETGATRWIVAHPGTQRPVTPYVPCAHDRSFRDVMGELADREAADEEARANRPQSEPAGASRAAIDAARALYRPRRSGEPVDGVPLEARAS